PSIRCSTTSSSVTGLAISSRLPSCLDLRGLDGRAPTHPAESGDSTGTPRWGAEAGVKGPVAAHPPALRAGTPEVCAPPCATLSLAPPADAANIRRTSVARR